MRGIRSLVGVVLVLAVACAGLEVTPREPFAREASRAMEAALEARRAAPEQRSNAGATFAEIAREAAPGWVAPERFLDEALRFDLRGPEVLARRRAAVAARPDDAGAHYLLGRLGGAAADLHLDRAAELDAALGWAWHGLAWNAHRSGRSERAVRLGRAALALARDPHERAHFGLALARYHLSIPGGEARGRELLRGLLKPTVRRLDPRGGERETLAVELARIELAAEDAPIRALGVRSGLQLVASPRVTDAERRGLLAALASEGSVSRDELRLALSNVAGAEAFELQTELGRIEFRPPGPSTLGGARSSPRDELGLAYSAGDPTQRLDAWLEALPRWTVTEDGLPRRAELRAVVEATRAAWPQLETGRVAAVAEALLAAGWFEEALGVADRGVLASEHEREVRRRALAAMTGLRAVDELLRAVDRRESSELEVRAGQAPRLERVSGLGDLLDGVEARLTERRILAGLAPLATSHDLASSSPRVRYGPIAEIVHPGPRFSAEDARLGRGEEGAPVPGLAATFGELGRVALFGEALGQGGPDGAILRVVHEEWRAGDHLGRPYRGAVFWCQGADVPARFARLGASISGAALHEGYWVDLAAVERERLRWERLAEHFTGSSARTRAALDVRPVPAAGAERAEIAPAMGAANRVRLAVMVERGAVDRPQPVSLEDLAAVVAAHEEGHLCDRADWYPMSENLGQVLGLLLHYRLDGQRIAEAFEERAQLTALCVAPDPRLALTDLLDAAERVGPAVTPHAAGYRRVLARLLHRMLREVDAGEWPELASSARLVDQLHRVAPERLRALALREARARRLAK